MYDFFAPKKGLHIKEETCRCNAYINDVQKLLVRIYAELC